MSIARSVAYAIAVLVLVVVVAVQLMAIPVGWAIVLGLPLGGVVLVGTLLSGAMDANWEPVPAPSVIPSELHASTLATRLAEAAADQHRFTSRVQPRLQRLAVATLRGRPGTADLTSLADPRAKDALGPDFYSLLTDPAARLPEPQRLAELLDRLEGR